MHSFNAEEPITPLDTKILEALEEDNAIKAEVLQAEEITTTISCHPIYFTTRLLSLINYRMTTSPLLTCVNYHKALSTCSDVCLRLL